MKIKIKQFSRQLILTLGMLLLIILSAKFFAYITDFKHEYYSEFLKIRKSNLTGREQLFSDFSGMRVGPKVTKILPNEGDSLVPYLSEGRYGYFSISCGKEIIPAKNNNLAFAYPFSKAVSLAAVVINDTVQFVDRNGNLKIKTNFPYVHNMDEILFQEDSLAVIQTFNELDGWKYSLIDQNGRIWLNQVESIDNSEKGYRVFKDRLYGIFKKKKGIFLENFDEIRIVDPGFIVRQGNRQQLLDEYGNVLSTNIFDTVQPLLIEPVEKANSEDDDEDDYCYSSDFYKVSINDTYGVISTDGKLVVPCMFSSDLTILEGETVFKAELSYGKILLLPINQSEVFSLK